MIRAAMDFVAGLLVAKLVSSENAENHFAAIWKYPKT